MREFFEEIENFYKNRVTLILDEADAAFTVTDDTTAAELKELKELLGLLKILTKETGMVQYSNKHSLLLILHSFLFFIQRTLFQFSENCFYLKVFYSILKYYIFYTDILY